MKQVALSLGIVLPLLTSACLFGGGPGEPIDTVSPVTATSIVFQTDRLVIGDSSRIVVRDENRWSEVWSQASANEPSAQLSRPIDFTAEMVLVAAAGRLDTGAQIRFDSVGVRGDVFVANVVTTVDCGGFTSDVYPMVMVRTARSELPVRWVERREQTARCR